jgi:hypothetical protein
MGLDAVLRARSAGHHRHPQRGRLRRMGSAPRPLSAPPFRRPCTRGQGRTEAASCPAAVRTRSGGPRTRADRHREPPGGAEGLRPAVRGAAALLAAREFNLVVLGSGEPQYEEFFTCCSVASRRACIFTAATSDELAHWIEAASDMFLMPSRYEPCGLNQMYSLRYGTVPVVRRTGGLADSVQQFDPAAAAAPAWCSTTTMSAGGALGRGHRAGLVRAAAALATPGTERHGAGFLLEPSGAALR